MRLSTLLLVLAVPAFAGSPKGGGGVLHYKPSKADAEGGRPIVTEAAIKPQGMGFAIDLTFDKGAWSAGCKSRCGTTELLIDVDADTSTGMQQGRGRPNTGADLDITLQGYSAGSEPTYLKAKVRQLSDEDRVPEDGDSIQELDSRSDEQLQLQGTKVNLVIDASSGTLPAGKTCRLIYLPPSSRAVTVQCKGLAGAIGSGKGVTVMKGQPQAGAAGGSSTAKRFKNRSHSASTTSHGVTDPGAVKIDKGGSAYDPNEKNPFGEGG